MCAHVGIQAFAFFSFGDSTFRFHALSYTAKTVDPVGFQDAVSGIGDLLWDVDGTLWCKRNPLAINGKIGVNRLLERDGHRYRDNPHLRRFEELIADEDYALRKAFESREPMAVVCHGDFNRNNVLFRYGPDGRAVDAMPFDFAMAKYGSPALDLSFFVFMNTTKSMRDAHYDDLLDAYCTTLAAAVPPRSGVRVPNRTDLNAEMAISALSGFKFAAFFLPWLRTVRVDPLDRHLDDYSDMSAQDYGTEYVADMVQHIVDMGYTWS